MKRLLSITLLALLIPIGMRAQEVTNYDLWIAGTQITSANASEMRMSEGTVSFDPSTNTLTLNGAYIGDLSTTAIKSNLPNLTVYLIGTCNIALPTDNVQYAFATDNETSKLTFTTNPYEPGSLRITGYSGTPFNNTYSSSNIVYNDELEGTGSTDPQTGSEFVIEIPEVDYGLRINSEISVTSLNRYDILGDRKGSLQFDGDHTLIFNGAPNVSGPIEITSPSLSNLVVYLNGDNTITGQSIVINASQSETIPVVTFTTDELTPGSLTLRYQAGTTQLSDVSQAFSNVTSAYQKGLSATLGNDEDGSQIITIEVNRALAPIVSEEEPVNTLKGGDDGDGLGKDIEGIAGTVESPVAVSATVNNIHYNLGTDDGFVQDGDDKLVALNTTHDEDDIPEDAVPGTPEFNVQGVLSMLIPAGDGKITIVAKTEGDGEPVIKMGTNLIPRAVPPTEDGHMLTYTFKYAAFKATFAHIFNKVKTPATSRHRAPGKKMPNTIGIKSVSVSARRVASAPPPSMSPKALTKEMVAAAKEENHIAVSDKDVTSIASDAFVGQSDITYVDLSGTSITGNTIDRTEFPADAIILLPAGNTTAVDTKNVVIGGVCEDLLLDDGKNFEIPSDFTAVKVAQKREYTADKNSTVCLPYALDETQASALGTFYEPTAIASGTVTMTSVTKTEANVPYMLKAKGTKVSAEMVEVKKPTGALAGTETRFVGTYSGTTLSHTDTKQYYCFTTDGTFIHVETDDVHVKPFRAYIALDSALGRSLDIDFGDGTTGIKNLKVGVQDNVYYDLQGRRVLYPKKGIYIQNGKKVIIK